MTSFAERSVAGALGVWAGRCSECARAQLTPQLGRADRAGVSQDSSEWVCPLAGLELLLGVL